MKKLTPLFILILIFAACKKDVVVTKPVDFTSTSYQALGSYDAYGTPSYLINPPDAISSNLLTFMNSILVEKSDLRKRHPELLSINAIADIAMIKPADVYITFVSQQTTSANTLAFYTYPTNTPPASPKDIKTITYFFPSAGLGSKLKAGDKVKIGRFEVGTSIGFALMKSAWNATTKTVDTQVVHFLSNDVLNPEVDPNLKKHAVLINYPAENKVLIGFENTDRTSPDADHDFNDIVIYATFVP